MSQESTWKELPPEMISAVREKFEQLTSGESLLREDKYALWAKRLNAFLKANKDRNEYKDIWWKFEDFPISAFHLLRVFNRKTPHGGIIQLRNLVCRFASDGKKDFSAWLRDYHGYEYLRDEPARVKNEKPKSDLLAEIKNEIRLAFSSLSPREKAFARKAIKDDERRTADVSGHIEPVFPPSPFEPKWPASETRPITVRGFEDVWLKDESTNPTGCHKDRFALEIAQKCLENNVPEVSIISSGSAAIALKYYFDLKKVKTKLKVLVDRGLKPKIKKAIRDIGCELYEYDLSRESLDSEAICEKTNNTRGFDLTYRLFDPLSVTYYDWLSYEILREKAEVVLIPFGTGELLINVLNIVAREFSLRFYKHDRRFETTIDDVRRCRFLGATTKNPHSKMDKLYSHFLPSMDAYTQHIQRIIDNGCIDAQSGIYFVEEGFVERAVNMARRQGINGEPSGLAGLALLLQLREEIPVDKKILIVNTGHSLLYPPPPPGKRQN